MPNAGNPMDDASSKRGKRSRGVQYGLPALFALVTFICVALAYPQFVFGSACLFVSALAALLVFSLVIYFPVAYLASLLTAGKEPPATDGDATIIAAVVNSSQESETMPKFFVTKDDCSQHTIFPGVNIFTTHGEQMMISLVEFEPGATVEQHSHPHEQMGLLLEGELTFTVGGETRTVAPGEMWCIPGGVPHGCVAGDRPVKALDVFHPIRDDYR